MAATGVKGQAGVSQPVCDVLPAGLFKTHRVIENLIFKVQLRQIYIYKKDVAQFQD